jgi:hypothetical protein
MDENLGQEPRTYAEVSHHEAGATYDVHDVSAIAARLMNADGQDAEVIALVQRAPFVARVARS